MGVFENNIQNGPKITAQVIRDFQKTLTVCGDDPIDVVCDKICEYIFYWVHAKLLDYRSFTVKSSIILGETTSGSVIQTYNPNNVPKYIFHPRIEEFICEMKDRGFELDVDVYTMEIKINW